MQIAKRSELYTSKSCPSVGCERSFVGLGQESQGYEELRALAHQPAVRPLGTLALLLRRS